MTPLEKLVEFLRIPSVSADPAHAPDVRRAAASAALSVGMGPRSSAVVAGGHTHYHRALECELAALKKTDDAVLFPTGFAANVAVVSALAGLGAGAGGGGEVLIF